MTTPGATHRGICLYCDCIVYPGRDSLVRPGGQLSHRKCWRRSVKAEASDARREWRIIVSVVVCCVAALVALMAVISG